MDELKNLLLTAGHDLDAIEQLAAASVPVSVNVAPLIPGLNDEDMPRILADVGYVPERPHLYPFLAVAEAIDGEHPGPILSRMLEAVRAKGGEIDAIFFCPHKPEDNCDCRKPRTGLLTEFLAGRSLDRQHSFVIGDRDSDMQLAANLGLEGLRVRADGASALLVTP